MKIDIFMRALLKTLLIWVGVIVVSSIGGGVVIYSVTFITDFIISNSLSLVVLIPILCAILYLFGLNVNYNYREMLK